MYLQRRSHEVLIERDGRPLDNMSSTLVVRHLDNYNKKQCENSTTIKQFLRDKLITTMLVHSLLGFCRSRKNLKFKRFYRT